MRSVTKESLNITKIQKMELLMLAACVTLVGIWLRPCEEKKNKNDWKDAFPEVNENIPVFILCKQHISNCCWTEEQVVSAYMWSLKWKNMQSFLFQSS